ncbi:MAG: Transcriptional regulator, Rrf2 family [Parcubacteria group bacterium GW2011_GWE2_39_37]|uniref:Transcriptional regulator, Rrf2 family n=1 Tax=Candidatus Falkowbacteria bacterium GW2011_GWF2_39_8 TaxID=1618642 RepID=A0A0G0PXR2_9BACT|nr:MAG: Transcriptional regulator, Rrf2 family [Parcubacteria group bacterium GW2011_GWE2_39_37]KKR32683.1 MAG: Transcriptional regulator, Rrf2 family [Candidatus Falkowbacteria bacterium GW2011_GWF2_39_8]
MKFSTKTTYGLRAIIRLAKTANEGNVSLSSIANEEKISLAYLEKLFSRLKKAKLVNADKGVAGGYSLAKESKKTSVFEIIEALEGKNQLFYCLNEKGKRYCSKACSCEVNSALGKIQTSINQSLSDIKLSELLN